MGGPAEDNGHDKDILSRMRPALDLLFQAHEYAQLTSRNSWEFAVEIQELYKLGMSPNNLRLLVRLSLVEHAREASPDNGAREFKPTGEFTFTKHTCFVLTSEGIDVASEFPERRSDAIVPDQGPHNLKRVLPTWDVENRILCYNGQIVKKFNWYAANQETVLAAFEEEHWPTRIDDPLAPQPEQDAKRRLSDTIKCLNRKQKNSLIHFRGDGTGEGVIWELVEPDGPIGNGTASNGRGSKRRNV